MAIWFFSNILNSMHMCPVVFFVGQWFGFSKMMVTILDSNNLYIFLMFDL